MPGNIRQTSRLKPVYEDVNGWHEDITKVRQFDDLPQNAKDYVKRIEDITGVVPAIVSVGPDREETLLLKNPFEKG
jgi:adenylosuccinate synthase